MLRVSAKGKSMQSKNMQKTGHSYTIRQYKSIETLGSYVVKLKIAWDCLETLNQLGRKNKAVFLCSGAQVLWEFSAMSK